MQDAQGIGKRGGRLQRDSWDPLLLQKVFIRGVRVQKLKAALLLRVGFASALPRVHRAWSFTTTLVTCINVMRHECGASARDHCHMAGPVSLTLQPSKPRCGSCAARDSDKRVRVHIHMAKLLD